MNRQQLLKAFTHTRALSLELCRPLAPEDYRVQTMTDVSPPWWNLGHTSWFFARNILAPRGLYTDADRRLEFPLNSYYEALGPRLSRDRRGLVTRPTTDEVLTFRRSVDERIERLIRTAPEDDLDELGFLVTTGIHHEQQHQELLVTEVKHILGNNTPGFREAYAQRPDGAAGRDGGGDQSPEPLRFVRFEGGVHEIGNLEGGWCWDNELPVHKVYLENFALADRLVTNREYLAFIEDGGYEDPLLWMSNGWAQVNEQGWRAPLYWERPDDAGGAWRVWTLGGMRELAPHEPLCHVSFYEADAFCRWLSAQGGDFTGVRLPTETEWEHGARTAGFPSGGANLLDGRRFHPAPSNGHRADELAQTAGDVWEWTSSHYEPYPGYKPFEGSLMEYNGKFMDNQRVLRGGSCATPANHLRVSYRNFWPAGTRFQLTGLRLAKGL